MNELEQARLFRTVRAAKKILDEQDAPPIEMVPCPFCGSMSLTAMAAQYVECLDCRARGPMAPDLGNAITCWHRRFTK